MARNPDPWLPGDLADPPPRLRFAPSVRVYRYTPPSDYEHLDNVECVFIEQHTGADPGIAGFRYVFGNGDPDAPQSIEEALSLGSSLPKTVLEGDHLVVKATRPDAEVKILFDGHALDFGMALAGNQERVNIHAVGIARRLKDTVIGGAYLRDASTPNVITANFQSDLVAQFNPRGVKNATASGDDVESGGVANELHPIFIDPNVPGLNQRHWTLPMVARFLIFRHNADEDFVINPIGSDLDALLVARIPISGTDMDYFDPGTYTQEPIIVSDKPLTGRDWPTVLHEYVRFSGFDMAYMLDTVDGDPETRLRLWHRMGPTPKDLWLQPRGSTLDGRLSNIGSAQVKRDLTSVITDWQVDGALKRYEASFILAPGFPMDAVDGSDFDHLRAFDRSSTDWPTTNHDKYRLYIFDECGEGHYAVGDDTIDNTVASLNALFGSGVYTRRRRKPLGDLLTTDPDEKPLRYRLSYSTDYAGTPPELWDGTGTWTPILRGFHLIKDRIGIYISIDNPNHWVIGEDPASGSPLILRGVEDQCSVSGSNFCLRLTCVVEGDQNLRGIAVASGYSPLDATPILRRIDARDRYRLDTIAAYSEFNNTSTPIVARDDQDAIDSEAAMNRAATEAGLLEGSIEIPYLTDYYELGDPIRQIDGRNLSFRTDGGTVSTPVYPLVEGRRWDFDGGQRTTLMLSDESHIRNNIGTRKMKRT